MRLLAKLCLTAALAVAALGCPKKAGDFTSDSGSIATTTSADVNGPPAIDVCALIPVATVATATGIAVDATDPPNSSTVPNCTYRTKERVPKLIIQKSVSTLSGMKSLWPGGRDVAGVGDGAYLAPRATELVVQKGNTVLRLAYEPAAKQTDDERLAVLKKLADLALPALAK